MTSDLTAWLQRDEGKTLEFKRDLSSPAGVLKTVTAFANTAGGAILIGVEDRTRHVRGVEHTLDVEERIANLVSDGIAPQLLIDLEVLCWRDAEILLVRVHPSSRRPHWLTKQGRDAGVYVRVGSTNRRADKPLIEEMRRTASGRSYDEEPMLELDSEAIDFRAASEFFAPHRKLKRTDLRNLRLMTRVQDRWVPTVGGVLLFGADRLDHFPDAWLQAGRFAGLDKRRILDQRDSLGYPPRMVEDAVAFVEKHTMRGAEIGRVHRVNRSSLPTDALREAIVNAVVHGDYSQRGAPIRLSIFDDRVEIENPGLLPLGLTVEDMWRGVSKVRNRVFARVFRDLGLVEQWGSGVQRMSASCAAAGLPPPEFEELGTRFRVTLRTEPSPASGRDAVTLQILELLANQGGHTTSEIASAIGLSTRATRTRLRKLVEQNTIRELGTGPKDPRRRYFKVHR